MPGKNFDKLSFAVAKQVLNADEIARLACAFLNSGGIGNVDYEAAAEQFGNRCKAKSFKHSVWAIKKKIRDASSGCEGTKPNNAKTTSNTVKVTPGRKRKAASEIDQTATKKRCESVVDLSSEVDVDAEKDEDEEESDVKVKLEDLDFGDDYDYL